jgi:hypothetical protein
MKINPFVIAMPAMPVMGAILFVAGFSAGEARQADRDHATIVQAQQNEDQAAGLEDECKQTLKAGR